MDEQDEAVYALAVSRCVSGLPRLRNCSTYAEALKGKTKKFDKLSLHEQPKSPRQLKFLIIILQWGKMFNLSSCQVTVSSHNVND